MIKTWDLVGSYAWSMPFNNGQAHHILQKLPEKCPLHPQRDLLADNGILDWRWWHLKGLF